MRLAIHSAVYPDIRGWVGLDFWTADPNPQRFVVRVSKAYARKRGWDLSLGLEQCVEAHSGDIRVLAQDALDEGASELFLMG